MSVRLDGPVAHDHPRPPLPGWVWSLAGVLLRPASLVSVALVIGALLPMSLLTTGIDFCPFKLTTGLPCPGCGITRASVAFLHGDMAASLYYHPLGMPMVLAAVVVGVVDAWVWWRSGSVGGPRAAASQVIERLMLSPAPWVAVAALALVWVVRLPLFVLGAWVY